MLTDLKRNSRATNRRLMQKALLRGIFHAEAIYPFFVVIARCPSAPKQSTPQAKPENGVDCFVPRNDEA